jgi:putative SOS response-associated peptidase YedK
MCGRITLRITADELQSAFGFAAPPDYRPRYNIAPSQGILALASGSDGTELRTFRWGLVPSWADDPGIGSRMINARGETVAEKPAFRSAFGRRRCLVLVDGFYEWQRSGAVKRPHLLHLRSGGPFTLAGLWEVWSRGGRTIESCTIITTAANPLVAPVHDRMPVILGPAERDRWMAPTASREELKDLLRAYPEGEMALYEVSTVVNSPANDTPACAEPLAEPFPAA